MSKRNFLDIDPVEETDDETIIFMSISGNKSNATNSKIKEVKKTKSIGAIKLTPKNMRDSGGLTLAQLIDLKPSKNVVKEFFKMKIENLEESDYEEDEEEEKPKKKK